MKNLRVTGITLKQDRKVYVSDIGTSWTNPSSRTVLDSDLIFKHDAEYSEKRVPIKQMCYTGRSLDKDEIVISGDIARELGVTVGDKINIKLRFFGKSEDDYLTLYEKKPKKFIKYFSKQSTTDKKKILKELLEYDKTNEEVIQWLDKNYSDLIREVGLK